MQVLFFRNFQKKQNSTKRPNTGSPDRVLSCQLKENCSIESPVLKLSYGASGWQDTLNYCYIPGWGRFYKVSDAVYVGGTNWEVHLQDDALASNYAQIIAAEAFIEYSGLSGERYVPDTRLTMRGVKTVDTTNTASLPINNHLTYYVTVLSDKGIDVTYEMSALAYQFFADHLSNLNATDRDTLVLQCGNVFNAVTKVIAMPFKLSDSSYQPTMKQTAQSVNCAGVSVTTGGHDVYYWLSDITVPPVTDGSPASYLYEATASVLIPWDANITDFRNLTPYTYFTLWLPFVGQELINPERLTNKTYLDINYVISAKDGSITYRVAAGDDVIGVYDAKMCREVAIGQVLGNAAGFIKGTLGGVGDMVGSALGGNIAGLIGATAGTIVNLGLNSYEKNVSVKGSSTGLPMHAYEHNVRLTRYHYPTVTNPDNYKATIGAPYMRVDTLGNHAGYYVKTNNASIAVSHYTGEADAINSALNSGVYLE